MLYDFIALFDTDIFRKALGVIADTWLVWLPLLTGYLSLRLWLDYKEREWINSQEKLLLEIRLPNELVKSPAAMEVFVQNLHQVGVGSLTDVYFKGRVRPWFSLELVSDEGRVHFYIWTFASQRKVVETQLYAHFPNIEVYEVPDYALPLKHDTAKYKFGKLAHMILTKADAYPIKTYIDYGLDKDPDEEYKNDPIAPVIEFLGSLKKGEHAWIQILLRGHTKEGLKYMRLIPKADWKAAAEAEIKSIASKAKFKSGEEKEKGIDPKFMSEAQKDTIKAIERSIDKIAFDTMIRVFYFAEIEAHNPSNIGGLLGSFKQFGSANLNGFKPGWSTSLDYPWQDFKDMRKNKSESKMIEAYKRRAIFHAPFKHFHDKPFILTTEEVATIYHFSSNIVVATPTLTRIPSKKAEAPANLPV